MAVLLDAARLKAVIPSEVLQQRVSFAHGNANIEGDTFSRATVTMVILPDAGSGDSDSVLGERRRSLDGILRRNPSLRFRR